MMPTTKDKNFLSSDEGQLQYQETYSHAECMDGESYVSYGLRFSPSSHVIDCKKATNYSFLVPMPPNDYAASPFQGEEYFFSP